MPAQPEIKAWADELDKLLQKAVAAAQSGEMAGIVAAQKALRAFKETSPDYADALDTQASLAIFDLDLQVTEEAVENIKSRAAEVYRLAKLISGIAEEANAKVAILDGTLARKAIDTATATIGSLKELRDGFGTGKLKADEKAVADQIDAVLAAIQALRNKLETA